MKNRALSRTPVTTTVCSETYMKDKRAAAALRLSFGPAFVALEPTAQSLEAATRTIEAPPAPELASPTGAPSGSTARPRVATP